MSRRKLAPFILICLLVNIQHSNGAGAARRDVTGYDEVVALANFPLKRARQ